MVQMTEFDNAWCRSRVVMPLSVEEYRVAQMFMVTRMQEEQTSDSEGVEVLVNEPFENEEFGMGQYTSKIYYLQSKAPSWLTAIAPTNSLLVEEEAWNAYPKCKTILKCPYFNKFKITIDTMHVADNGQSTNIPWSDNCILLATAFLGAVAKPPVHKLPSSTLSSRRVEIVDIASNVQDYWSYVIGGEAVDLTTFKSEKTGRGLLVSGWQETCHPVMTAYKLVTVDAPYWGFGYRLEQLVLGGERALFVESHKRCFAWIDEWIGLSFEEVRKLELQMDETLKRTMSKHDSVQQSVSGNGNGGTSLTSTESKTGQRSELENSPVDDREAQVESQHTYSQSKLGSDSSRVEGNLSTTVAVMI